MLLYEMYWIRYFKSKKMVKDMYNSLVGIPLPGAILPVFSFLTLGIYGNNILLIIASVILGIGHIGIHLGHYKKYVNQKVEIWKMMIKFILIGVCIVVLSNILLN